MGQVSGVQDSNIDYKTEKEPSARKAETLRSYLGILSHFTKNRTQVYMYVGPTVVSMLIASGGIPSPLVAVSVVLTIFFMALSSYMYNDVMDVKIDKINSSSRPVVSGRASKREVLILAAMLNVAALSVISLTNLYATLVASLAIILGIVYSYPRTNLKEKFPHKTIAVATGGALSSLLGGVAVGIVTPYVIYASLVSFAFLFIMSPIADISDLKGDRAAGRRTFAIVLGVVPTIVILILIVVALAFLTTIARNMLGMNMIGMLMIIGICNFVIITLRSLTRKWESEDDVWKTRNKMKTMHLLLQLSLLIGVLHIAQII